jgi:hypothetical protein
MYNFGNGYQAGENMKKISWLIISIFLLSLCTAHAADEKIYTIDEVFLKNDVYYDKITKKAIDGIFKEYHESGNLKSELIYKKGNPNGLAKEYFNGILNYHDGKGKYITEHIRYEYNYIDGKIEGIRKQYGPHGKLLWLSTYKNGKLDGIIKGFYDSKHLRIEVSYKNGKRNGYTYIYYKSGNMKEKFICKNDKIVSGFIYSEDGHKEKMTNVQIYNRNSQI